MSVSDTATLRQRSQHMASIAARLDRLPVSPYHKMIVVIVATAFFFDSMDLGSMTFLLGSIRNQFALTTAQAGLLSSMSFLGMMVGAAGAGMLGDRFGLMTVFQASMILWGAASIFCGLAPSVMTLGIARVLLGLGMGMEFPIAQSIVSELIPTRARGRYIALLDGGWPLGFIASGILASIVLPFASWRWVFIIEGLPAIFVYILRRSVPESPRWLAASGRAEQAEHVVAMIETRAGAASGGELPPPVPVSAPAHAQERERSSFATLWEPAYLKRSIMVWMLWFLALLGFYGLTSWLGALLQQAGYGVVRSVWYTVVISLAGVPGFLASAWLVEGWGRKPTCVLMLLGSAVMAYAYGAAGLLPLKIIFGLMMQFFFFGMWAVLYAYTPELYPTRARATGCGYASAIGRLGALIGPYVVGIILPAAGQIGVFSLGAGAFALAALAVMVLGPETRGQMLEAVSG
jgi:putative MFS transporter